ncbi:MAG: prepilin-type N-terminal cleavage/methylation domain-containing protein [Planctomycetaceae bacterium]|nr:MAG: prepilin-type N-terminal cleavage/methylation domain-containing protein [Planctomycetaceae bacterium]
MVRTSDKIIANCKLISASMVDLQIANLTAKATASRPGPCRSRCAFTLIEMMVVVSIIILLAATALPSVFALFNSGADSQAYNLLSATLTATRTEAIQNSTYTLVHVQFGDGATLDENKEKCWIAVFMYDKATGKFKRMANYELQSLPGTMAFGRIDGTYIDSTKHPAEFSSNFASGLTGAFDKGFRRFSIVFSPTGSVVTTVNGAAPSFDAGEPIFTGSANAKLWITPPDEAGVTAVTLFDYRLYSAILPQPDKAATSATNNKKIYLDDNGQLIGLNVYTGQLLPRK